MSSSKIKNDNQNHQDLWFEIVEDNGPLDNEALYYT